MNGATSHSTLSFCLASTVSAPDPLLNLAQERDLSNAVVVVESGLSQCWNSLSPQP